MKSVRAVEALARKAEIDRFFVGAIQWIVLVGWERCRAMMSTDEATRLVEKTSKCIHALLVSRIMVEFASELGEDSGKWEVVGLLHDLDCDQTRDDLTKHGLVAAEMLRGRLSEDCAEAIRRHDYSTGLNPESSLDWALVVADTMACVIEKMPPGISSVEEIEPEIERIGVQLPWLKENLGKYRETGQSKYSVLRLLHSLLSSKIEQRRPLFLPHAQVLAWIHWLDGFFSLALMMLFVSSTKRCMFFQCAPLQYI